MMVNFNAWMAGNNFPYTSITSGRAVDAWRRISDKPTSITVKRGTSLLSAQTVRIEYDSGVQEVETPAGEKSVQKLIVFGVKDHPAVTNTDLQRGDRFVLNNLEFEVMAIVYQTGEIQAQAEARS